NCNVSLLPWFWLQDTDFILLDEPLNNLDIKQSIAMMKILRSLVDDLGKTIIIVIQ
ncbi:ABC-type enterochelin transport system, ATPase component, partial [Streptococcus constellatus subsp. constellatus SK53]